MKTYGQYVLKCSVGIWTDSSHAVICLKKYKKREKPIMAAASYTYSFLAAANKENPKTKRIISKSPGHHESSGLAKSVNLCRKEASRSGREARPLPFALIQEHGAQEHKEHRPFP